LTDLDSGNVSDATLQRGEMPVNRLEDAVHRDLCWLLQTTALDSTTDLTRWPHVRRSVLNFGVPIFAGRILGNADLSDMERAIQKAILLYEPRLVRNSLEVRALHSEGNSDHREIRIQVTGQILNEDQLIPMSLQVHIDTESGRIEIDETP
jgi:type VI secretion system protein ImpF